MENNSTTDKCVFMNMYHTQTHQADSHGVGTEAAMRGPTLTQGTKDTITRRKQARTEELNPLIYATSLRN